MIKLSGEKMIFYKVTIINKNLSYSKFYADYNEKKKREKGVRNFFVQKNIGIF